MRSNKYGDTHDYYQIVLSVFHDGCWHVESRFAYAKDMDYALLYTQVAIRNEMSSECAFMNERIEPLEEHEIVELRLRSRIDVVMPINEHTKKHNN